MEDLVASTLSSTLKIPHAVARFLVSRGIKTVSDAYHMLCSNESDVHDPFLMMGMDKAIWSLLYFGKRDHHSGEFLISHDISTIKNSP